MRIMVMLSLLLLAGTSWAAEKPAGHVALAIGNAWLERAGERIETTIGTPVFQADVLVTGRRGRLKVLFTDDALVSLGSNSRVLVARHLFEADTSSRSTRLELVAGKLRALVQKMVGNSQADFQVKTTNAVAGVRGTEFILEMEKGQTRLYTLSGEVALSSEGAEPVLVAAGHSSFTDPSGRPLSTQAVAAAELERLRRETDSEYEAVAVAMATPGAPTDRLSRADDGSLSTEVSPDQENGITSVNFDDNESLYLPEGRGDISSDSLLGKVVSSDNNPSLFIGAGKWENPEGEPNVEFKISVRLHR